MKLPKTAFISLLLPVSLIGHANEQDDDKKTPFVSILDEITVSADRQEKTLSQIIGDVSVINSQQIDNQLSTGIGDIFRYETDIQASGMGRAGTQGYSIRGLNGDRVKIMVDGVDMAKSFDIGDTYLQSGRNFIDTEAMKRVEVVKGPSSSLYGSDALGGIVAFTTKDPSDYLKPSGDDAYAAIKSQYNSSDESFANTLSLAARRDRLSSLLVYTNRTYHETNTFNTHDNTYGNQRQSADPEDGQSHNLLGKLQYQLRDNQVLGLTTEYYTDSDDIALRSRNPSGTTGDDERERTRISLSHRWDDAHYAFFDHSNWQLSWQDSNNQQDTRIPAYRDAWGNAYDNRLKNYTYEEKGVTLNGQFNKALLLGGLPHALLYGINSSQITANSTNDTLDLDTHTSEPPAAYMPKVKTLQYGFYGQDEIQLSTPLQLTLGVRYDGYRYQPSTTDDYPTKVSTTSDGKTTARAGLRYQLNPELSAFGQFSQGFKAPGYKDLYFTMDNPALGYKVLANPDLKPEQGNSWEAGLKGRYPNGSFQISAFYNRYQDFIETQIPVATALCGPGYSRGCYQSRNIADATIKGIAFKSELWLGDFGAPVGTTLKTSISWTEGEGQQQGAKTQPLNSVDPLKGVIGLAYDPLSGLWGSALSWTLVAGKKDHDIDHTQSQASYATSGYGVVDMTFHYKPVPALTLRAGLFNVTDKEYWRWNDVATLSYNNTNDITYYSQPGRNFAISANYQF